MQDELINIHPAHEGKSPRTLQHGSEPGPVTHKHWIVHAKFAAQFRSHFRRDIGIGSKFPKRVAGREREHGKQRKADTEQARDGN